MAEGTPTPVPLCDCHGEPKLWHRDKRKTAGGTWVCAVKNRERCRAYSRAQGRVPADSPEYIEKLRAAKVGKPHPPDCAHCAVQRGELNAAWTAERVGYFGAHNRHRKALAGLPCACADDSCKGPLQSALKHDTPLDRLVGCVKTRMYFSPWSEDYMVLCQSHHRRYDMTPMTITMPAG